ncbi:alpha-2-macroglobulin family protein [Arenibaculum pallidiluteum]|uniref:alpha-2-macroglobulin family protein n=1 Tax=Arenibaculum pallidiluteum TaxID=2812559 RepID=UPI001A96362D|nr:MG2 domain-containing protein [Arenibaculum pallidiluteum]
MTRLLAPALAALLATTAPAWPQAARPDEPPAFAVQGMEVVAERDRPQACFTFTRRLERPQARDYARHVAVQPAVPLTSVVRDRSLCLEGFAHGESYTVRLAAGLPGAQGARLPEEARFEVAVPDRAATIAFRNGGYVLPRVDGENLALRTTNIRRVRLAVLRIEDRELVERAYFGRVGHALSEAEVGELLDKAGQPVWQGEVSVDAPRNQVALTELPTGALPADPKPGVYVAVADDAENPPAGWAGRATQWFVSSDIGMTTFQGEDGLTIFVRSVRTAAPVANAELRLLAHNRSELGRVRTDEEGIARLPAEAFKGSGVTAAQALVATHDGDFNLLDLAATGVRPTEPAGAARAFLRPDRGAYRPGETANVVVLLRDQAGRAVGGRPAILKLTRPDGLEVEQQELRETGAGGFVAALQLPPAPMPGAWTISAHLEAEGPAAGSIPIRVEEFVLPRLALSVAAAETPLQEGGTASLTVEARLADGEPAANLPGEMTITLRPTEAPFPGHGGYRFGLVQEQDGIDTLRRSLPGFTTGPDGRARLNVPIGEIPDLTHPMEALISVSAVDLGGGTATGSLVLPVRRKPLAIGLRPRFDGDAVPENATAAVEVIAVDAAGAQTDHPGLAYELFEEIVEHDWFEANGRWDYRARIRDRRLAGGTVNTKAAGPVVIEQPVGAGRFRLEVFDRATGAASSIRFTAGWWVAPIADEQPDAVELRIDKPRYAAGETARVFVRPPYESQVLVAVATDRRLHRLASRRIGPEGGFLEIPVDGNWAGGAHVLATAFAPADGRKPGAPGRALGQAWLALDPAPRRLEVAFEEPPEARPRTTLPLRLQVRGAEDGAPVFVTVAAVDEALLAYGGEPPADPLGRMLGGRPLRIAVRDVFGRLVQPEFRGMPAASAGAAQSQDAPVPAPTPALAFPGRGTAAVQSAVVRVGPDGRAEVPVALPDFAGRLRLTAIAWSAGRMGHAVSSVDLAEPAAVAFEPPRFLRRGDSAVLPLGFLPGTGTPEDWKAAVSGAGALAARRTDGAVTLEAMDTGPGTLRLDLEGPDGFSLTRDWSLPVRGSAPAPAASFTVGIGPGAAGTPGLPEDAAPDQPRALTVSPLPDFGLLRLLGGLDLGSTGAERILAAALPLLRALEPAAALGSSDEAALRRLVQTEADRLLTFQRPDGAFGHWAPDGVAEPWLTAQAVEFLQRAREAGLNVPQPRLAKAQAWLNVLVDMDWFDPAELPARAYAYYVLARAKAIDPEELKFFLTGGADALPTALGGAHLAAAFAALGQPEAGQGALERADRNRDESAGLRDWGSPLRDRLLVLALLAEHGLAPREALLVRAEALAQDVAAAADRISPQERAAAIQAAQAIAPLSGAFAFRLDGQEIRAERPVHRRLDPGAPLPAVEAVDRPLAVTLTTRRTGVPPAPEAGGMSLSRRVLDTVGRPARLDALRQGERLVVLVEGQCPEGGTCPVLVTELVPAGFVIESVKRPDGGGPGGLGWLGELSPVRHLGRREDRLVAALDPAPGTRRFRLAYVVRAAVAGRFAQPPASAEDMDRPGLAARTAAGTVTIAPEPRKP